MKILTSRKGFTLIELLVVIGILAVLAAIAIPSVAGLIDRANVSSDKTNSNEMTNALERFTSEYELYCQDIASGTLDPDNLDSAQGRVKNVIGVTTRSGIEGIEFAQNATVADDVIAIYRDTKYPMNAYTMQKVVENYTKTSSSTFEPKQSDMHFWYSPDCGIVVFAKPNANVETDLNSQVISNIDAKGNELGPDTQWIDITIGSSVNQGNDSEDVLGNVIPNGAQYVCADGTTLNAGQNFPETVVHGDIYYFEDYIYQYLDNCSGWKVFVKDYNQTTYGPLQKTINDQKVVSLNQTFYGCANIESVPVLHENITDMAYAFYGCKTLKDASNLQTATGVQNLYVTFYDCNNLETGPSSLPSSVTNLDYTFYNCYALKNTPDLSSLTEVKQMNATFHYCSSLTTVSTLPPNVESLYWTFGNCRKLKTMSAVIPSSVKNMTYTFGVCLLLEGNIEINANPSTFDSCFYGTEYYIYLVGDASTQTKNNLAATTVSSNVFVR